MGNVLYYLARALGWFLLRVVFQTRIIGRDRIPREGPLLVIANHTSLADPPIIGVMFPRRVDFMAMSELFHHRFLGGFVRAISCIPVDRSRVDHAAAREAIRRLRAGHCVAIFPEGGIRTGPNSVLGGSPSLRPGVESIALLGHAAILPVILRDSRLPYNWRNWFGRKSINLTIGYPFCLLSSADPSLRENHQQLVLDQLMATVHLPV